MTALEEKEKEIAAEAEDKVERFYCEGYFIGILVTLRGSGYYFLSSKFLYKLFKNFNLIIP